MNIKVKITEKDKTQNEKKELEKNEEEQGVYYAEIYDINNLKTEDLD